MVIDMNVVSVMTIDVMYDNVNKINIGENTAVTLRAIRHQLDRLERSHYITWIH